MVIKKCSTLADFVQTVPTPVSGWGFIIDPWTPIAAETLLDFLTPPSPPSTEAWLPAAAVIMITVDDDHDPLEWHSMPSIVDTDTSVQLSTRKLKLSNIKLHTICSSKNMIMHGKSGLSKNELEVTSNYHQSRNQVPREDVCGVQMVESNWSEVLIYSYPTYLKIPI